MSFLLLSPSFNPDDGSCFNSNHRKGHFQRFFSIIAFPFFEKASCGWLFKKVPSTIPRYSDTSNSSGGKVEISD